MNFWTKVFVWGFLLMAMGVIVLSRSGFFREQSRMREARGLIEGGGYAYCAIWGDGTDPFQLMARNSPLIPQWQGERQADGSYVMTFSYRRSRKQYRHQWTVDLSEKRVVPVGTMSAPIPGKESEMRCTDR